MNHFLKIEFNGVNGVNVVKLKSEVESPNLDFYYKHINTDIVEFVSIGELDIVVDEEGLLKSNNPVLKITIGDNEPLQLAGTIIIGKQVMTTDGYDTNGMRETEISEILKDLKVDLIGFTR